jgi:hypothetical protein
MKIHEGCARFARVRVPVVMIRRSSREFRESKLRPLASVRAANEWKEANRLSLDEIINYREVALSRKYVADG